MQIVKYKWSEFKPFLIVNNNGFSKIPLLMQHIEMRLGKKTCIGHYKDGKYVNCPGSTQVDYEHLCNYCRLSDDFYQCIQCDGTRCINDKRREECMTNNYYIYLATFGRLLKVGISYEHRIKERLVEQGADFGAKIGLVKDGRNVRVIEKQVMKTLNIVDRVRGEEKYNNLFGDPNVSSRTILEAMNKLNTTKYDFLIRPEIYDLRNHYHLHNILTVPRNTIVKDNIELSGKVVAAKGNILILEDAGEFQSVNAHALIGREILDSNF